MADHAAILAFSSSSLAAAAVLKDSEPAVLADIGTTVAGSTLTYKMRGQDDGRPAPGYIYWSATFPDFLGTEVAGASPPLLGSLVPGSVVEISRW